MSKKKEKRSKQTLLFPFQLKITLTKLVTFGIFFSIFLSYTVDLFISDKKAYVFDTIFSSVENDALALKRALQGLSDKSSMIQNLYESRVKGRELNLDKKTQAYIPDIIDSIIYHKIKGKYKASFYHFNRSLEDRYPDINFLRKKNSSYKEDVEKAYKTKKRVLKIIREEGVIPHFLIIIPSLEADHILVNRVNMDTVISEIYSGSSLNKFIIDQDGKLIFHNSPTSLEKDFEEANKIFFEKIRKARIRSGVNVKNFVEGSRSLVAHRRIDDFNITAFCEVPEASANKIAKILIFRSIVFFLFVAFILGLVSLFLSRLLTAPIKDLVESTKIIAQGKFDKTVEVKSRDEMMLLASSFNRMTKEIRKMIGELEEKARMENELAVAKLVQESFFPVLEKNYGPIQVSGHIETASECGGDWWGHKQVGDKIYLFLGDATGHGVPAALATATASCCAEVFAMIASTDSLYQENPHVFLQIANKALRGLGGKVMMTFFFSVYDIKKRTLTYANASHTIPVLFRETGQEEVKLKDLEYLESKSGAILGLEEGSQYQTETVTLNPGDSFIIYSDGIIEGENKKGKQLGDRKFAKSFLKVCREDTDTILEGVMDDAREFYDGVVPEDDISLLAIRVT